VSCILKAYVYTPRARKEGGAGRGGAEAVTRKGEGSINPNGAHFFIDAQGRDKGDCIVGRLEHIANEKRNTDRRREKTGETTWQQLFLFFPHVLLSPLRPSASEQSLRIHEGQSRVDAPPDLIEDMNELLLANEGTDKTVRP
jgi:hypothetical protein